MRYYDGYEGPSWCAMADDSVTQGSLCPALTLTVWVRIPPAITFFSIFLELEFYIFRNNDQIDDFRHFLIFAYVF